MTDILSIGASAAQLYRQALATVSNNIANLNTEGYSKQTIESSENTPSKRGVYYLGTGSTMERTGRAYDQFAEANLRTAQSNLASQEPIIKHTNKLLNYLGSDNTSLSSAFDKFFSSLSRLSAAPSNATLKQDFLASSEYVASRFAATSAEMGQVDNDVKSELESELNKLNEYAEKLGSLNASLAKHSKESQQPSALLDQRDFLMLEMSKLARINFVIDDAGIVTAGFEGSSKNTVFVDRLGSTAVGVQYAQDSSGQTGIVFDPFGDALNVGTVQGGSIGGLINLRSNIIEPLRADVDIIVSTFVSEANLVHQGGLTREGQINQKLFTISPNYAMTEPNGSVNSGVQVSVDGDQESTRLLNIAWDARKRAWNILEAGELTELTPNLNDQYSFKYKDLSVTFKEPPLAGRDYLISSNSRPADSVKVSVQNIDQIASADRLIIEASSGNVSGALAKIDFGYRSSPVIPSDANDLSKPLGGFGQVNFEAGAMAPGIVIPQGDYDFEIELDASVSDDFAIQVITSEKNHLVGKVLTAAEQTYVDNNKFFNSASLYGSDYLNETGANAFLDKEIKLGNYNSNELSVTKIPLQTDSAGNGSTIISANQLALNGVSLGQLDLAAGETLSAKDIASWVNSHSANTKVTATSENVIKVDASQIDFEKSLLINGIEITGLGALTDVVDLAAKINSFAAQTDVLARADGEGGISLYNRDSAKGDNISLGTNVVGQSINALGLTNSTYTGQLQFSGANIDFSFVDYAAGAGKASDLAKLGLTTKLSGSASALSDMAVSISGSDGFSLDGKISVGGSVMNRIPTIEDPLEIKFTTDTRFQIIDTNTNTVISERDYDFDSQIIFNDLKIALDKMPAQGDSFKITANLNSAGDNSNLQRLLLIQDAQELSGATLQQGYERALSKVGAVNSLAKISEEALEVVYEDAVTLESSISGVSLDDEAADLIRFQQSFQAAAQVIKVSSTIFDSILSASR